MKVPKILSKAPTVVQVWVFQIPAPHKIDILVSSNDKVGPESGEVKEKIKVGIRQYLNGLLKQSIIWQEDGPDEERKAEIKREIETLLGKDKKNWVVTTHFSTDTISMEVSY